MSWTCDYMQRFRKVKTNEIIESSIHIDLFPVKSKTQPTKMPYNLNHASFYIWNGSFCYFILKILIAACIVAGKLATHFDKIE